MIALYARVSTAEQATGGYSIDEQTDRLRYYAAATSPDQATALYVDPGYTGSNTDRPALKKLISDVTAGRIHKVLVYKLDRLSRSQKDTLHLIEDIFLPNQCEFASVTENFDTATPLGRAMIGILSVFAQLEREQIRERMALGKEGRAKAGKWRGGGKQPVGYIYQDGRLEIIDFEALQIREIYERYARGESAGDIVRAFQAAGYRYQGGRQWDRHRVLDTLKNPLYAGKITYHGQTYPGNHQAIIPQDLWDRVQEIRAQRIRTSGGANKDPGKYTTLLGGLIYCKKCGARYTTFSTTSHGKKHAYYVCNTRRKDSTACRNNTWAREKLDQIVCDEIRKLATDPDYIPHTDPPKPDTTQIIQDQIHSLEQQRSRLIDLYTIGSIDISDIEERVKDISGQIGHLRDQIQTQQTQNTRIRHVIRTAADFSDILDHGTFQDIRLAIESLIDRISIDGEDIYIKWNFS